MMACPTCGSEQPDWAVQCSNCGAQLPSQATQSAPPGGYPPPAGSYPPPGGYPPPAGSYPPPGGYPASGGYAWQGAPGSMMGGSGSYAGWWYRVGATIIDGLLVGVVTGIITGVIGFGLTSTAFNGRFFGRYGLELVVEVLYVAAMLSARGQTLGMMAVGTRIADAGSGQAVGFGRAAGRTVLFIVAWWLLLIPGLVDVLWPLWDGRNQTLHDKLVNTVIVRTR